MWVGWDSSVSIATWYGLDGPGMESRLGKDFPHLSRPACCTRGTGSFPRGGAIEHLGHGVDHPPTSSAKVKEKVELYLYSPSGTSWSVTG